MNKVNCENENIKEANMSKVDDGKNQGTYIKHFCHVCKTSLPAESRFCPHCGNLVGARAKNTCETCGSPLQDDANYCIKCGTPVWGKNIEIQSLTDEGCTYDGMTRDTLESVKYINSNIGTFVLSDAFGNLHDQYMKQVSFVYHSADDSWGCEKGVLEFGICDDVRWTHKYVNSECKINEWAGFCYSDGKNNRVENLTEGKGFLSS